MRPSRPSEHPLEELAELLTGLPTSRARGAEGSAHPFINIRAIDDDGQLAVELFDQIVLPTSMNVERHKVRPGDLLLVYRGASSRFALVPKAASGAIASGNLLILRSDGRILPRVLWAWFNTEAGQRELQSRRRQSAGTSILRLKDVAGIMVPLPSLEVQHQIADLVESTEASYRAGLRAVELRRQAGYAITSSLFANPTRTRP